MSSKDLDGDSSQLSDPNLNGGDGNSSVGAPLTRAPLVRKQKQQPLPPLDNIRMFPLETHVNPLPAHINPYVNTFPMMNTTDRIHQFSLPPPPAPPPYAETYEVPNIPAPAPAPVDSPTQKGKRKAPPAAKEKSPKVVKKKKTPPPIEDDWEEDEEEEEEEESDEYEDEGGSDYEEARKKRRISSGPRRRSSRFSKK